VRGVFVLQLEIAGLLHLARERAHRGGIDLPGVLAGNAHVRTPFVGHGAVAAHGDVVVRARAEALRALDRDDDRIFRLRLRLRRDPVGHGRQEGR